MRVLVTGIAGFAGSHLAERLVAAGHKVVGTQLPGENLDNLALIRDQIAVIPADITELEAIRQAVDQAKPDWIFHLAAQASVGTAYHRPGLTVDVNVKGTVNVLEAARLCAQPPRTIIVSSAEVYGFLTEDALPVREDAPLAPIHTYAVSKVAVHFLGQAYHHTFGLPVIEARPFNHLGPRQRTGFVLPDFASQVAQVMAGKRAPVIRVGNLSPRRDFTDVRDVARAYELLAAQGEPGGVYHICSGRALSIQSILDGLLGLCECQIEVEVDPTRMRPSKMPILLGSPARLQTRTGWKAEVPIEQTLADTLTYWLQQA